MEQLSPSDNLTGERPPPSRRMLLQAALGAWALGAGAAKADAQRPVVSSIGIDLPPADETVRPFRVAISSNAIEDLRRRLSTTRWA